jgi:tetratricopeptide (TPR) repeat protein
MPPPGLIRRKWQPLALTEADTAKKGTRRRNIWAVILPVTGAVVLVALVVAGVLISRNRPRPVSQYTGPLATEGPSPTFLPSTTPVVRSATPTFTGPTPLWMQMKATYTPTALYVNTPHPRTEAYRIAMTAYQRGNWKDVVASLQQVVMVEPAAADAFFYMGEAYRQMGDYNNALQQYNRAITANPSFASAYLGRARVGALLDPKTDIMVDLKKAVSIDPGLGEAYLEMAKVNLSQKDPQAALDNLAAAEKDLPGSPLVYLYRAQACLKLDRPADALIAAQMASKLDFTSLAAYRVLGEARVANNQMRESLEPLKLYLLYEPEDTGALILEGRAYTALKAWKDAETAYNQALDLNDRLFDAYIGRGYVYLGQENGRKALADFSQATQITRGSFEANLGIARAYLLLNYRSDALDQLNISETMAKTDVDRASLYYWRAQVFESLGQISSALDDWRDLLALPSSAVPTEWAAMARKHLEATATATLTATVTATLTTTQTPTTTSTSTRTPTRTPTQTRTPAPSATQKATPTVTPTT